MSKEALWITLSYILVFCFFILFIVLWNQSGKF
jgi:hypothetical protein